MKLRKKRKENIDELYLGRTVDGVGTNC